MSCSLNAQTWAYDPTTDSWESLSTASASRDHVLVAMGGLIYLFGGDEDSGDKGQLREYDPEVGTWQDMGSTGTNIEVAAGAGIGGNAYIFGGIRGQGADNATLTIIS